MPQNQSSSKISRIIGVTLLFFMICFTIFINFPIEEPMEAEEMEEYENIEKEEIYFEPFNDTAINDLWKLDSIETKAGRIVEEEQRYSIRFYRQMPKTDLIHKTVTDENGVQRLIEIPVDNAYTIGTLKFETKIHDSKEEPLFFEKFEIECCTNERDIIPINEIGNLVLKYQINSITTSSDYGYFTAIHFNDGRKVF